MCIRDRSCYVHCQWTKSRELAFLWQSRSRVGVYKLQLCWKALLMQKPLAFLIKYENQESDVWATEFLARIFSTLYTQRHCTQRTPPRPQDGGSVTPLVNLLILNGRPFVGGRHSVLSNGTYNWLLGRSGPQGQLHPSPAAVAQDKGVWSDPDPPTILDVGLEVVCGSGLVWHCCGALKGYTLWNVMDC